VNFRKCDLHWVYIAKVASWKQLLAMYPNKTKHKCIYMCENEMTTIISLALYKFCKERLSLPFPFELPTASTINCKIICSSRQQRIPGSHMITSTTSHSKIIVFKTCKIASLSLCKCLLVYLLSHLFHRPVASYRQTWSYNGLPRPSWIRPHKAIGDWHWL
jgi:hypothetical protein